MISLIIKSYQYYILYMKIRKVIINYIYIFGDGFRILVPDIWIQRKAEKQFEIDNYRKNMIAIIIYMYLQICIILKIQLQIYLFYTLHYSRRLRPFNTLRCPHCVILFWVIMQMKEVEICN